MNRSRRNRLMMILIALVGVATVSVAYAAGLVNGVAQSVVIEGKIDVGNIINMIMVLAGGVSVWVKLNRSDARQTQKLKDIAARQDQAEHSHRYLRTVIDQMLLTGKRL